MQKSARTDEISTSHRGYVFMTSL